MRERQALPAIPSRAMAPPARQPSPSHVHRMQMLQRGAGNQALLRAIQRKATVSAPHDPHEREADQVADRVMRMVEPPAVGAAPPAIQRTCAQCEAEEGHVQRQCSACEGEGEVARAVASEDAGAEGAELAVQVAGRGGEPLPDGVRDHFEPRFGRDFSQVRVHADGEAAVAARAVNARAYTVSSDIVFGAGEYSPRTPEGQRLLAHELTHVVQQTAPATVLRDRDEGAPPPPPSTPTPAPPSPAPAQPVCGPDVTSQVTAAVGNTRSTFAGWANPAREAACNALDSLSTGGYAWDIVDLHNNAWILGYRPACASAGATPPCGSTVQVGTDCHYAGSPNYVIFGVMCKLCNDHFTATGNASGAARFTESKMQYWINFYKGTGPLGLSTPSGNFGPSRDWSTAGYRGWPGGGGTAPAGDRPGCAPTCPTPYSGRTFLVHWVPNGVF